MSLPAFCQNPFRSRSDLLQAAQAIIEPLVNYRSNYGARIKLRPAAAPAFDDVAAQLEGYARPLFAIASTVSSGQTTLGNVDLNSWLRGIEAGVDPRHEEYWGDLGDFDQRMVEMESISFALLLAPDAVLSLLSQQAKANLRNWLAQINNHEMPQNNWRWFRIFVNLALTKVLGAAYHGVADIMTSDFEMLDSFYMSDGWSSDGLWGESRKQADYYSGSFAIQFAQLLYVRFAPEDINRVERYRQQARQFSETFWRYFDSNGAAIPFGRSMTYRFAFAAFWAAAAVAGIDLPAPVDDLGSVKGFLLRHLRWWTQFPDIFNADGVMNIGFTYPNMYLCEDYNSPQSVYWCLKSFIVLCLPEEHQFWTRREKDYPLPLVTTMFPKGHGVDGTNIIVRPPRHIICNMAEHHYLLSGEQMSNKNFKAKIAKYGKFAYSSAFGFSVPTGSALEQMAPDSTLCVSLDGGDTWTTRWQPMNVSFGSVIIDKRSTGDRSVVPILASTWKPWKFLDIEIETTLVPLGAMAPGWHVRVHVIRWSKQTTSTTPWLNKLQLVDGGFAIDALDPAGYHLCDKQNVEEAQASQGCVTKATSCVLISKGGGATGISKLKLDSANRTSTPATWSAQKKEQTQAEMLGADPNSNLICPRTFIPVLKHCVDLRDAEPEASNVAVLASGVFAVAPPASKAHSVSGLWTAEPIVERKDGPKIYRIIV